jgi:ADP-heptose:LPS heptosyltransferase
MGGSALNWPAENFSALIGSLAKEMPVVITGTKADQKFLNSLSSVKDQPAVVWLVDQLKSFELLDILSEAKSVIAPSTGVLHLAASLGTPSLGIYSPRTVEHPRRWGPKGTRTAVLVPETSNPDALNASVMTEITPQMVLTAVHRLE